MGDEGLDVVETRSNGDESQLRLKVERVERENFVKLTINNCEHSREALDFLISDSQLNEINKTLIISVTMNTLFEHPDRTEIQNLAAICKTKPVMIIFFTESFDRFQIFWKSKEITNFLTLKPLKKPLSKQKQLFGFIADFLIHCLPNGHSGKVKHI